jgi:hypothetical protein
MAPYGKPLNSRQTKEAEAIDYLWLKCIDKADHKCQKLRKGTIRFSEATKMPLSLIVWWEIRLRRRMGQKVQPKQ